MKPTDTMREVVTSILINAFDASEDDAREAADIVIITCLSLLLEDSQAKAKVEFEKVAEHLTTKEQGEMP